MAKFENYDKLRNVYFFLEDYRRDNPEYDGGWSDWHHGWHDNYKSLVEWTDIIRGWIEANEWVAAGERYYFSEDKGYLRKLIYNSGDAGISSTGQSFLSEDDFNALLKSKTFMGSLENLIKDPSLKNYNKFSEVWESEQSKRGSKNNPLRVNRVAAACTTDVSSIVDEAKFYDTFGMSIQLGLIKECPENMHENWFTKNNHVMNCLKEAFSAELDSGDTDMVYLAQFFWSLCYRRDLLIKEHGLLEGSNKVETKT